MITPERPARERGSPHKRSGGQYSVFGGTALPPTDQTSSSNPPPIRSTGLVAKTSQHKRKYLSSIFHRSDPHSTHSTGTGHTCHRNTHDPSIFTLPAGCNKYSRQYMSVVNQFYGLRRLTFLENTLSRMFLRPTARFVWWRYL